MRDQITFLIMISMLCLTGCHASSMVPPSHVLEGHSSTIFSLAYSPDGTVLASGGADLTVHLWDTIIWKPFTILKGGDEVWSLRMVRIPVKWFAFSFDSQRLATAAAWAKLWDVETGKHLATLKPESLASYITMSPHGQLLAEMGWGIRLWDTSTGQLRAALIPEKTPDFQHVQKAVFLPDGNTLITGGTHQILPSKHEVQIRMWDVMTGEEIKKLDVPGSYLGWFELSPNGRLLAVASEHFMPESLPPKWRTLSVWDMQTFTRVMTYDGTWRCFSHLAFSPDNMSLAGQDRNGAIHVWDVSNWSEINVLGRDHTHIGGDGVGMFSFSPDGRMIASTHEEMASADFEAILTVWNVDTGKKLLQWTFERYKTSQGVASRWRGTKLPLSFSPDSQQLAIGRQDGTILIIDVSHILKK